MGAAQRCAATTAALALCACLELEPLREPAELYVLAALDELEPQGAVPAEPIAGVLGLGPLELPEYVLRPELVVREEATAIAPLADARWAEPLELGFQRVLARDLALLGAGAVVEHPWFAREEPPWQAQVRVERFERLADGRALLAARWRLVRTAGGVVREERAEIAVPAGRGGGRATARALSEAVAELARRIASSWREALRAPAEPS